MPRTVDVVIIGGGPAGLSAAIVLARRGLHTLVCEQAHFPVDKACGEGLMPTGLVHLEQLAAAAYVAPEQVEPFIGIRYHTPSGRTAAAAFAQGPGWGIRRTALSAALLKRAQEFECLDLHTGVPATPVERTPDHIGVQVGDIRVDCRLLIGADGLGSQVRRWANLEGPRHTLQRYGARQHFQRAPWSPYVEVYWRSGLEAYVTPCGTQQIGVSVLWDRASYPKVHGGQQLVRRMLQAFPELQTRLDGVLVCSPVRARGPLYRTASAPISHGVLLIGDAAGYLDAITGEGLSLALAQAACLDQTVVPLLQAPHRHAPVLSVQALNAYARTYRSIVRPYYRVTHLVLWLSRHPRLAERIIQTLGQEPAVFQHFLSANMGLVSPWSLGPKNVLRLLRGFLVCSPPFAKQS